MAPYTRKSRHRPLFSGFCPHFPCCETHLVLSRVKSTKPRTAPPAWISLAAASTCGLLSLDCLLLSAGQLPVAPDRSCIPANPTAPQPRSPPGPAARVLRSWAPLGPKRSTTKRTRRRRTRRVRTTALWAGAGRGPHRLAGAAGGCGASTSTFGKVGPLERGVNESQGLGLNRKLPGWGRFTAPSG
jgi:hypothetical protein